MRAKFYTNTGRYKGYCKLNDLNYLELRSWLLSGNYLVVDSKKVSTIKELNKFFLKKI